MKKSAVTLSIILILFCNTGASKNIYKDPGQNPDLKPLISFEGQIVFHSNFDGDNEIYLLTKDSLEKLTDNSWDDEHPVWSPDGTRIAYASNPKGHYDIHVMEADGTGITALTSFSSDEINPAWYPDGKSIAYSREVKKILRKKFSLYKVDLTTKFSQKLIPRYNKNHALPHISPSDPFVTFTAKRIRGWDSAMYNWKTKKVKFLDRGGKSCRARFSKDGKRLAYVSSSADGKGDIWIMDPDGSHKKRLTERDETYDYFPSWSPDGRYIVFNSSKQHDHNGDWQLMIIDVRTKKTMLLFDSPGNDVFPDWR